MSEKKHPPAFQFYPQDFVSDGDVEAMTTEEVGAYILLLCKAWYENPVGSIPDDDRVLSRWTRIESSRWPEIKNNVLSPFKLGADSRWHQKRLRSEYQALVARKKERSESGKRGAASRYRERTSIADPKLSQSLANDQPVANSSSSSSSSTSDKNNSQDKNPSNCVWKPPRTDEEVSAFRAEVAAYCRERGNSVDVGRWIDFYISKGWKVGKEKMTNWQASIRTWERDLANENARQKQFKPLISPSPGRDFSQNSGESGGKASGW